MSIHCPPNETKHHSCTLTRGVGLESPPPTTWDSIFTFKYLAVLHLPANHEGNTEDENNGYVVFK